MKKSALRRDARNIRNPGCLDGFTLTRKLGGLEGDTLIHNLGGLEGFTLTCNLGGLEGDTLIHNPGGLVRVEPRQNNCRVLEFL